jgi:flagellar biosynthesis/type III secretory pathway ATPase
VCDQDHAAARRAIVRLIAAYREVEDLVQIGAYAAGSNPLADAAIALKPRIDGLLTQKTDEAEAYALARMRLIELARDAEKAIAKPRK